MPNWKKVIVSGSDASLNSLTVTNGATVSSSLTLSGSINNVNYIDFNTSYTATQPVAGRLSWNNSDGTLDLGMKGGNVTQQIGEEIFYEVRNDTGTSIANGTSVYANGVTAGSGRITAAPFVADGSVREVRYLGLATEDISNGVNGFVTHFGYVRNLDTRGNVASSIAVGDETWAVGDILYAHPTVAGKLTNVKPKHEISVAIIIVRHQSTGVVFTRPISYGHLDDIHDININTGSLSTGDLLIYDSGSDYWINSKQLSGSYGLTGSLSATSFTGSLFGTASYATQALNASTASYVLQAVSSSFATNANLLDNLDSTAFAQLASANTFTNNQIISGSLTVFTGSAIEFQVLNTGTKIGNLITDTHTITGSVGVSGSFTITGNQLITGPLTVGSSSLGANENTITLGARDSVNEGGQIGFNAPGGTFTSASFIDNWSNNIRILRGSNATSDGLVTQWNLHTKQMQLPAYTSATSFVGTATANLAVDSSGNVITVSTSGGTVFPYTGNAVITGSLTVTQPIYVPINGAMYFQGGDDAALYDVNIVNTMGIYGVQDVTVGAVKLGSNGPVLYGSGSRLGLGTITPLYALDINANTLTGARVYSGSLAVGNITPSATVGRIDASNDIVAFSTSDSRLKNNIKPIKNALEKVSQIGGYEFDWNNEIEIHGYEGHDVGVIAQEIEKVLPEVVTTRDNGYKAVKYEKLVALLIESNKELLKRIEVLESKINQ
jgi:hypothetical protein